MPKSAQGHTAGPSARDAGAEAPAGPPGVAVLLSPLAELGGFVLACVADATTGMVVSFLQPEGRFHVPTAAAGAADIANVLSLMTARLVLGDDLEDALITFSDHIYVVRPAGTGQQFLLLVLLERQRANLALARREIRDFCARAVP